MYFGLTESTRDDGALPLIDVVYFELFLSRCVQRLICSHLCDDVINAVVRTKCRLVLYQQISASAD